MSLLNKRPIGVTWLAVGVLMHTSWSVIRFSTALQQWSFLDTLSLALPPSYHVLTGFIWALIGVSVTIGLWRGWHWASKTTLILALLYTAQLWVERLIFTQSATVNQNAGFILVFNIVILYCIHLILAHPNVQIFFGEYYE